MKMPQRLAFALFCALALPLAAEQRSSAAAGGFQISGVAINATNNLPVAQAHVTITLSGGSFSRTVMTGEDGRFAFDHLRAGKYALTAERHRFAPQAYEQHEGRFSTAIAVGPELDASNLTFRLAPDAAFSGRVTDDGNEPVRNARVMLVHELMVEGRMSKRIVGNTSTDDQGHYHFGHLKPGAYYIAVSARPWYTLHPLMGRMGFRGGGVVSFGGGSGDAQANPALDAAYPLTFYPDVTDAASASAITLQAGDRASADIMLRAVPA
ncbi:MAG: carboxypeptidase regulatory-like domain-containing protein, partial [Acidobacteriia bacterium]|nr:carboxypeptidase regulatory-like domain-containing protein [Terriglobia bacterium]